MGPSSSYLRIIILIIGFGQVAPQCSPEVTQSDIDCTVCKNQCPKGFYQDSSLQQCSTTTAAATTVTTESTQTTSTLAPSTTTSNETAANVVSDTTTGASQVQQYNANVTETTLICRRCDKQNTSLNCSTGENPDSGNEVAIIVGSTVGGLAVVTIVVVLVVFWCYRRRRSNGTSEPMDEQQPEMSAGLRHDRSADLVARRNNPQGDPTYQNYQQKRPTISSIEQGHDKVLRYTRDPTLKKELLNRSNTEDKELEELGQAPLPPGSQEVYEDTESRSDQSVARRGRDPLPPVPSEHRPSFSSQRNRPATGQGKKAVHSAAAEKHAKLEEEDPEKDYQNVERPATGKNTPSTVKKPITHKGVDVDKEDDDSSPDESYENVGAKKKLTTTNRKKGNSRSGQVNPAAADDHDEPQEVYGNQDAVEEQMRQSRPPKPARSILTTTAGGGDTYIAMDLRRAPKDEDDEVQPVYGNDANENPYVNLPFGS